MIVEWVRTHKARLAELITVNGGTMEVRRVGQPTDNREILTLAEALQLAYMHGCFDSLPGDREAARQIIQDEIRGSLVREATPEERRALLGHRM